MTQCETVYRCPQCNNVVMRGTILLSRVVNLADKSAKCARCKTWVPIPALKALANGSRIA